MVAVVAGNGLGLFNTSLNILGAAAGSFGQGTLGQAGGKAWVNASTGNLILRFTDEQLSGQGQDLFHTRTYNTLGTLNDGDVDGWRWEGERFLRLNGNAFAIGSTLTRTTGDGHEAVYAWNGTRYQSTEGDGAHDFIQWDAQNAEWYWTDGSTRAVERYNGSSGLLVSVRDTSGTLITYGYHNGKLTSVTDSSGQALLMVYNAAGKLARVDTRSASNGPLTQQVYYEYDSYGRLTRVSTDLTPDDNSIADGNVYATTYTYDGSSFRIASISQSDGSTASFTYVQVGSEFRVATVTDASGTTTFSYDLVNRRTGVRNLLGQERGYFYDEKGQLTYVQSPNINGDIYYTGYQYDADGNVIRVTDTYGNAVSYAYDERGNRILERDPKGVIVARTYNAANQLLSEIRYSVPATWNAASGTWTEPPASSAQVTRYVYDYAERLRFVVSATGSVVEYTYETRGLRAQEIVYGANRYPVAGPADASALSESSLATWGAAQDRAKTRLTGFNYDYRGNLILRVAYANVDASGNWQLDSAAELTRYVYNAQGQLLQTLAGRGLDRNTQVLLSSATYDGMGRVLGQMDANGTRTTVYNGSQRSIAVTSASGLTVTQLYDTQGRLIAVQEAASGVVSRSTGYFYDAAGRLNMKQDATGVRTFMFYDQLGRLGAEVDGGGNVTRYTYNYNDQRISELRYATPADTSAWFNGSMVSVTLAQILPASNAADRLTRFEYDQAGRLALSIDAAGTLTTYSYDGRGQLIRQQTGERIIRNFYDADGRQVGVLDAEGYLRENVYNAAGQLQQTIRYSGLTTAALRTSGSLGDLRPASGGLSTWNFYDLAGRQIGSVDEKGFVSETVYDEAGNTLKSIRYATAYTAVLTATSSFASVRTAVQGGASHVSTVAYDDLGRVAKRTAVDGSITTYEYDSAGRLVRETSSAGTADERSTRTRYDAFGQTTGKLLGEASGKITAGMSEAQVAAVYSQYGMTWSYDAAGRVASVTDAMGNRTLSYYDNTGRLTRVINAAGEVSETKYNAFGDAIERTQLSNRLNAGTVASLGGGLQTAALGTLVAAIRNASLDSRTSQSYDTRGLLLTSIDAEGISTTNQYDQYGQLQRQIRVIAGDRKVTTTFGYNLRGERISQTRDAGSLNLTNRVAYDAFGRVIRTTDAAGFITSTDYQDSGRTVVVRDPLNQARRSEFDAFGRTLREVDALGHITQYSYDDTNRSITVTLPDGTRVSTWKTRHGETLKAVDGKGAVTQYEYNREGQLTRTIDALGQVAEKRYDQAGRLSESVDARGIVTHLDYDAANRVIERSVDPTGLNQRTTYVFDTAGRQIKVVEFAGTTSARTTDYTYDRKGQLTQTVVDPSGLQLSTRYSYDGVGNVLRISQGTVASPEQRVTDYVYNAAGQRRFTVDALGYVSERKYDAIGNVVEETRYANKLQGSRDSASLQRLGVNRLDNVEFVQGSDGLPAGWGRSLSLVNGTYEVGLSQPGLIPQELTPGDNVVRLFQPVRHENPDGYMEMSKSVSGIQAGHRYSFSVYTAAQGTTGWAFIYWVDATRNIMGFTPETSANQNLNEKGGGTSLADYKRLVATGVAPEGAVSAIVVIRKNNTLPGYGATQFLAAHPQFEEVALDGGDASPWSRPLAKSTDDGVTSYVYDAVGRQRFSVDALGYVSERKYDSAGKVIEETRYANKLQGLRDSTTLQKLGVNWLDNVEFVQGSDGLPAGWGRSLHAVDGTYQVGLSQPGLIPKELTPGDNVVRLFQPVRHENPDGYMEMSKAVSGVQAGHRYSFSVYTAAQGTTGWAFIYWVDAAGNIMSFTPPTSANQNLNEKGGGTSLADYKRLVATGVAPEGAVSAIVVIRKNNTLQGYGATQFLAVHPQFEEIALGGSNASPWSRPLIKASADDRVTSYVYDALGRQRFSVDALGYVSERKYDAAGNVIEETRYANKLQGPRDSTSLQKLGVNRLDNVEFIQGSDGLPAGWGRSIHAVSGTYEVGLSQPGMIPQELTPGDNVVRLFQPAHHENPDGYMEMSKSVSGIQAGHRYSFSVYTAAQGTTGWAFIYWVDAAGNIMSFTPPTTANQNLNEKGGGTSLADYKRLVATGVAPEGAVSAIVVIRKNNTLPGYGATQFLAVRPQFEEISVGSSEARVWTRPPIKASADDRVTRYVYDALGRQRFSVDALGYVSERKYDAAGNVIEETRYANKLQGPRDSTSLQKLGVNRLDNVEFVQGSDGLPAGWGRSIHAVSGTYEVGLSQPGMIPQELTPGDNVMRLFQPARQENPDGYMEMSKSVSGIQAGHRYSFSVYTAAQGTTGWAFIYWVDAAGNIMSFTPPTSANQNLNEKGGGTSLADYKRLVATGVAPEGAASAIVVIRKNNTLQGYGATQLLAVHPQFEELAVGSSDASAWTRPPIVKSADDRVTSYVYDTLGRQRFSVDALGYVSERKYDATGNVVEEVRYANKLQGPRDSASLQKLGVNRLDNVEFIQGSDGLPAGWGRSIHAVSGTYEVGLSQPGMIPQELTPGDNVVRLFQPARHENPDGYMEMSKSVSGIQAGHRYSFSVYTAAQGTTGWAFIYWVDAAGNIMSFTPPTTANQNLNEKGGGTSLADYKRLVASGVAPEGAVSAFVVIRKNNTLPGYGATQFLAVHPQFEEIALGGSDASPWSRPLIKASADDRVTSYVHDALGRQRFSVDALGYVSERKYDAAGNVIEETRYANKLQGPRDSASLQKLGVNRLDNVEFVQGSDGLPAGWGRSLSLVNGTYEVGLSQPGLIPKELTPGDNVVRLFQPVRHENPDGYMEMSKAVSGVQAGHRYSFSVYTAAQGTTGWAFIYWVDAAGNIMSFTPPTSANQNLNEKGGGTSLADYKRLVATGVAPEGAVSAIVVIRKNNTLPGYGATQFLAVHPQFEEIALGGSDASPWSRPLIKASADDRVTSYVHDALGRQRFSVDALGYVSERKYDAAGNVTEEIRYANKLQGPRDSTTLQKLGVNRLDNAQFVSGTNGFAENWGRSTHAVNATYQVRSDLKLNGVPLGDNLVRLYQDGRNASVEGYMEASKGVPGIQAGHRYSFSVYTASQGANAWAFIYWVDAAGNIMSFTQPSAADQNLNEKQGGSSLADYKRLVATGVAPEGAVSAIVVIRKNNTLSGFGSSQLLAVHPQFEEVPIGGSDASTWSRSLIINDSLDRVTRYTYDPVGQLKSVTDPLGYKESYTYDAFGNRTSLTNKNGQTWNYGYDQAGQLFEEITPSIWYSNIDSNGWGTGQSVSLVTRYGYDAFGSVTSRSEGRLRDNPNSDPALDNVSRARTSTFGYDALGRQVRITSPGWYNKSTGQYQQNTDGSANTFQVTTEVTYDGLGNAVRNRVRVNNTGVAANDFVDSYKAYDVLGQVRYEVDALKGVTAYEYDGFGQTVLTRRNALPLNAAVPASGYYQPGNFNASTAPFSPGNDRTIITRYDNLGRKTEVQQNVVSLYDFTGNVASSMTKDVAPVKAYSYNAFGQVTRETLLARDTAGNSVMEQISTVNYYDRVGQRVGTIDALGYYTRLEYTGSGKVSRQVEYATALSGWSEAAIPTAAASAKDRSVRLVYDAADRLVQTVRENATYWQQTFAPNAARATTTQVTGDVVLSRSTYDGVGNALTLTDALGNVTTTEYNALGQVVKVTEPARYAARDGATNPFENAVYASPTTVYGLNAFGQVVYERRDAGAGQAGQIQITRSLHDAAGHLIKEFDAAGSAQDFKVDVAGRRLEESRQIYTELTGWRYNNQTLRRTFTYDSLGQQLSTSDWYTDNGVQKSTTNSVVYNRFGEITTELLNGNYKASYAYNQIGNVIQQTNVQGVTSLFYDLTGKVSRSAQLGDLTTATDDRITYQRNDLLGRMLEQHLPAFEANLNADTLNNVGLTLTTPIIRQTSDRWGNVLSRIVPRGYVTTYAYDHNNQVLAETLPVTDILRENGTSYRASLVHEKRYDALGQLIEEADVVDGNVLRTRQHVYNQAGELVRDIDALGASRYYIQDANGNRVGTYDPLGIVTFDNYDEMDRHVSHGILSKGQRVTLLTNQYDQAGRLYAEIDGTATVQETLTSTAQSNGLSTITGSAGNTRFTVFDERGNIVQTRIESNIQKAFVFNEANRKVAEIDGLGNSLTWTYNESNYGRLTSHKDLGNRNYSYAYNAFGQVVAENADKAYVYYANGLLKSVSVTTGAQRNFVVEKKQFNEQWQAIKTSTYAYDLVGNKVSDALTSLISWSSYVGRSDAGSASTRQENRYRFDEAGRLADAHSLAGNLAYGTGTFSFETRYTNNKDHDKYYKDTFHYSIGTTTYINLSYKFDEFGNRRRVTMNSLKPNLWDLQEDNWFKYDLNDRAVVVDGFLENGAVVAGVQAGQGKGYTLSYDAAGRRVASERWTSASSGQALYERSEYAYNSLNQVESRSVRNVYRQSGANSNAATQSVSSAQLDLFNVYDDRGRVVTQTTYKSGVAQSSAYSVYRGDNQKISEVTYTYTNGVDRLAQANYFGEAGMIDAAGNQTRYRYATFNSSGAVTQSGDYQTVYIGYETYKSATLTATASNAYPGVTTYVYNDRGDLLHLSSNTRGTYRRFAVDGDARMVGAEDAYTAYAQIYLNYQNTSLANSGRLSQGVITDTLVPISADYPAHAPSSYVVNEGDTLESIAQVVWGDRSMWYLIADANGKDLSEALVVGSSLRIPNVVSSNRNDATTFKPYNPAEVIGDTITPPVPPKPKKKKCNAAASIVMVVVAVVATVFTAGAAGAVLAGAASSLSTAAAAGVAAFSGTMAATGLSAVAAFGIGAAVGSVASQAAGMAMGVVDSISWKQVAVAGLGGAIGAGITSVAAGANSTLGSALDAVGNSSATWQQVAIAYGAQGVAGYAGSYIASKVVGLDTSFSWKGMAASAVGSIVGGAINQKSGFWNASIRQQISAHTSAWMKDKFFGGNRPDYGQVAMDAFGNTLGDFLVGRITESEDTLRQKQVQTDSQASGGTGGFAVGGDAVGNAQIDGGIASAGVLAISNGSGYQRAAITDMGEGSSGAVLHLDPTSVTEKDASSWYDMISEWLGDFRGDVGSYFKPYVSSENLAVEFAGRAGRGIANGVIDMVEGNVGVIGLVDPRHAYQVFHDARTFSNYVMADPGNALANAIDGVEQYFDETSNIQIAEDVLRLGAGYYSGALLGGAGVVGPTYRSGTKILGAVKSEVASPGFGVLNAVKVADIDASISISSLREVSPAKSLALSMPVGNGDYQLVLKTPLQARLEEYKKWKLENGYFSKISYSDFKSFDDPARVASPGFKVYVGKEWPLYPGDLDGSVPFTLLPGTFIDRFGSDYGSFLSPVGTPYTERSLKPGTSRGAYSVFEVLSPIEVEVATIRPWFGESGMGIQYKLPEGQKVKDLISSELKVVYRGKYGEYK
ncbi:glycohydrolase toxin TNT-related protein [Pseudomonas wadenswilerensis]